MSLEQIALAQEEIIAKQSAVIRVLLEELSQYRAITAEEQRLLDLQEKQDNKRGNRLRIL